MGAEQTQGSHQFSPLPKIRYRQSLGAWQVQNLVYFLLDEKEHKFFNIMKENTHEKNNRFI